MSLNDVTYGEAFPELTGQLTENQVKRDYDTPLYHAYALPGPAKGDDTGTGWTQEPALNGSLRGGLLELVAMIAVPFIGEVRNPAETLRTLPPL